MLGALRTWADDHHLWIANALPFWMFMIPLWPLFSMDDDRGEGGAVDFMRMQAQGEIRN